VCLLSVFAYSDLKSTLKSHLKKFLWDDRTKIVVDKPKISVDKNVEISGL